MNVNLDIRLPLSAFRKVPFIYTGVDYKLFPVGTPLEYLPYQNQNIPALLPCTLYSIHETTITDRLFSFAFPFIDEDTYLAIYLTHPVRLENKKDISLIHCLFDEIAAHFCEVGEVALFGELQMMQSTSCISYPTSLTHFSYNTTELSEFTFNSQEILKQYQEAGFREYRSLLCYECEIDTLLSNLHISLNKRRPYEILEDFSAKNLIKSLQEATSSDMIVKSYSIANQLTFISPQYSLDIATHGVSILLDAQIIGFFQWIPNLFELPVTMLPTPFLYPELLQAQAFRTGKIFSFGIKSKDEELFKELLHQTVTKMREKGMQTCQIGYVDEKNEFLQSILDQLGFTAIHSLEILKKDVK